MTSTVYIAKNVYGGDGLGRLGDGRVVFVPGAWTGENVKAEIVEEKRHFVKARLVEVVEPSPDRIAAGEEVAVPGCVYSELSWPGERRVKTAQLVDFLERARLSSAVEEAAFAGEPLHYRNKAVYHFARQGGKWAFGYRREGTHDVVDLAHDPMVVRAIDAQLPEIRRSVTALLTTGPESVRRDTARKESVTVRWTPKTGVKWWIGEAPKGLVLKETTCGLDFEVPADGFYQVNPAVGETLVRAVVDEYVRGADAAPDLLDLYCGVGVFGLACVRHRAAGTPPPKLTGIESGRQAIDFAKRNAQALGVEARFFAEEVGRNLRRIPIGRRTTVIVDPPRGGLEPRVPGWLAQSGAPRILYVSCDPATLMRDLRTLASGYDVERVQRFDMFPRTARFETLVTLKRKERETK